MKVSSFCTPDHVRVRDHKYGLTPEETRPLLGESFAEIWIRSAERHSTAVTVELTNPFQLGLASALRATVSPKKLALASILLG